ncbi:MAG: glycogen debranching protein GlgX, partial [Psychromonas sp.]|nr:glycogen debranching protein GlgX [Psychromonas sp.]
ENEIARHSLIVSCGYKWHVFVGGIKAGQKYGYRIDGEYNPEAGLLFNTNNLLIDPYAKALSRVQQSFEQTQSDPDDSMIAKSIVVDDNLFDWDGVTKPFLEDKDRILYEVHAKGFSQLNKKIQLAKRGKYLGLSDPISIAHYKKLGITSLQILPVFSFMSEPRLDDLNLTNYWGYNPINFFAPDNRYAQYDAVTEFKQMVKELHANGIEVILDVVYNHTAEGGFGGPILSLKGFDNRNYYTFENQVGSDQKNYTAYSNHSGCGNTVNNNTPWMLKLTIDSLRYWVEEMQVDGFRFDLAVTLAREKNGFSETSAFFKAIYQDPILSETILIAEPWDIGPGGYRVGGFPEQWLECNDRYRDISRSFWRGDTSHIGEIATRLLGSRDLFAENYRTSSTSVNYLCYHDGFTLEDLVSYENRHNEANAENNRDGHGNNLSINFGIEGKTSNVKINALREKQKRNLIAMLFLSQGTPHFLAGDEMGNTQQGNNNAYCQDNELSWLSWHLHAADQKLFDFTSAVIAFRKQSIIFSDIYTESSDAEGDNKLAEINWYHPNGHIMEDADWHDSNAQVLSVELKGKGMLDEHWFIMTNASTYNIAATLPIIESNYHWEVAIDTT